MDFQKKNIQMRYKESMKTRKENSNKSFFLFVLLVLILFLMIQNNFVKESLFPTKNINYTYYSNEESIDYGILQEYDLMDRQLKEKFDYYIQLSVKNKDKTNHLKIETSILTETKNKDNYASEIVQYIHQFRNDNVLLAEQPIDVVILSNNKEEIFRKLIK